MALAQSTRLLHAIGCDSEFVSPGLHLQRDRGRTGGGLTRDDAFHARHKFRALPHSDAAFADCRTLAIRHGELQRSSAASWDHDIELGQADRPWRPTARCSHRRPRDRHGPSNRVHTAVDGWRLPWHRRAAREPRAVAAGASPRRSPRSSDDLGSRCRRAQWPRGAPDRARALALFLSLSAASLPFSVVAAPPVEDADGLSRPGVAELGWVGLDGSGRRWLGRKGEREMGEERHRRSRRHDATASHHPRLGNPRTRPRCRAGVTSLLLPRVQPSRAARLFAAVLPFYAGVAGV